MHHSREKAPHIMKEKAQLHNKDHTEIRVYAAMQLQQTYKDRNEYEDKCILRETCYESTNSRA